MSVLRVSAGHELLTAVVLQGEMGPDGAKGERGEPGMTVSAWQSHTTTTTTTTQQNKDATMAGYVGHSLSSFLGTATLSPFVTSGG